jgi:hypothetical protein
MRRTISSALAVTMVAGLVVTFAGTAAGRGAGAAGAVGSRVSISHTADMEFQGRVRSDSGVCKKNRKVRVYMVHDGPDMLAGSDRTNKRGRYSVDHTTGSGQYYAKAMKKVSGTTTCKAAKSSTIQAP